MGRGKTPSLGVADDEVWSLVPEGNLLQGSKLRGATVTSSQPHGWPRGQALRPGCSWLRPHGRGPWWVLPSSRCWRPSQCQVHRAPPPPPGRLNSLNLERQFRHREITLKTASRILFPPILNRSHFIVECRNLITLGSAFTRLLLERNSSLLFRLKPPVCITEIFSDLSIFFLCS